MHFQSLYFLVLSAVVLSHTIPASHTPSISPRDMGSAGLATRNFVKLGRRSLTVGLNTNKTENKEGNKDPSEDPSEDPNNPIKTSSEDPSVKEPKDDGKKDAQKYAKKDTKKDTKKDDKKDDNKEQNKDLTKNPDADESKPLLSPPTPGVKAEEKKEAAKEDSKIPDTVEGITTKIEAERKKLDVLKQKMAAKTARIDELEKRLARVKSGATNPKDDKKPPKDGPKSKGDSNPNSDKKPTKDDPKEKDHPNITGDPTKVLDPKGENKNGDAKKNDKDGVKGQTVNNDGTIGAAGSGKTHGGNTSGDKPEGGAPGADDKCLPDTGYDDQP